MPHLRRDLVHSWQVSLTEAADIQRHLATRVVLQPRTESPRLAAGVDVAYSKDGARAWAVAVVMGSSFKVVTTSLTAGEPDAPYVPGYLAFREGRLTIEALTGLSIEPDIIFLDGHGVVHERGLGLASHVGVLLDLPTIGVPKTPFHAIDHDPGPRRGDHYVLTKEWGAQLRSGSSQASSPSTYHPGISSTCPERWHLPSHGRAAGTGCPNRFRQPTQCLCLRATRA